MDDKEIKAIMDKSRQDRARFEANRDKMMRAQASRETAPSEGGAVTLDMTVAEIIEVHPSAADYLVADWNMACISCPASQSETLREAAQVHKLDPEDVCEALNDFLEDTAMIQAEELE